MIDGAHVVINSPDPDADRAFLRDVIGLPHVDAGDGWLIFGLPPSEIAVHPAERSAHEIYFMCPDIEAFAASMKERAVPVTDIQDAGWGRLVAITLPGGSELGIYEPRHERAPYP